jgi:cytochrome c biogenesis factor
VDPNATAQGILALIATLAAIGWPLQAVLLAASIALAVTALVPALASWRPRVLGASALLLAVGEGVLVWFHWRLYQLAVVASPETGTVTGRVAVPLWVESEKLYVWALIVAVMGLLMRRHREELLGGVALITAVLMAGAAVWGRPFTEPLPQFLGQYGGYLQALASGVPQAAWGAYQGMEGARQYYYNSWFMWVHPPLLFFSYGAFAVSFVATIQMVRRRYSAYETTAYRWARLGYLPLTAGMLLGFPWAILAWQGESWWWSGKVNMSIMMWFLYTAYLHARLYLRRREMWKMVAVLAILSFVVLVLTYLATYVVPGAHSYA